MNYICSLRYNADRINYKRLITLYGRKEKKATLMQLYLMRTENIIRDFEISDNQSYKQIGYEIQKSII